MAATASLKTNFKWVFAGNVVNSACQWAIVSVLAKLGSPEMLGTYALAMAVVMPVTSLAQLQMRPIYVTDAARRFPFGEYLSTGLLASLLGLLVILVWSLAGGYGPGVVPVILLLGLSRSLDNPSEMFRGYCQKLERMEFVGLGMMLRGVTSLGAMVTAIALTGDLVIGAAALVAVAVLRLFTYEIPVARHLARTADGPSVLRPRFAPQSVRRILAMGLPLGLAYFLSLAGGSIMRLTLEAHHGKDILAYFAAAAYPLAVGTMVAGSLGQSASPRLSRFFRTDRRAFLALLGKMLTLAMGLGLLVLGGVWLLGDWALRILYRPEYATYHTEFIIIAGGSVFLFLASMLGYALTASRVFRLQLLAAVLACAAAALASWLLIPAGGIRGAAWAFFWTGLAQMVTRMAILARVLLRKSGPDGDPGSLATNPQVTEP